MSSADPSKFMATANYSTSTMNIELNWGSPYSRKGPQNHNENGDPGSPILWGPQNLFYDTGIDLHINVTFGTRRVLVKLISIQSVSFGSW